MIQIIRIKGTGGPENPGFLWLDAPFVGTVFCNPGDRGVTTEWLVSGKRWEDESSKLILRFRIALPVPLDTIQTAIREVWESSLRDLAFGSAISGGVANHADGLKVLSMQQRKQMFDAHLKGHAELGHFNIKGDSRAERTANMYLLLKSLGSKQPQQAIASFESIPFVSEVKATAINQRLAQARKAGFLPAESEPETKSH